MIPFSCHLLPLHSSSPYLALRLTNGHSILCLSLKSSQCDPNLWATSTVISFLPVQIKYLDLQSHPRTPLSIISGPLTFGGWFNPPIHFCDAVVEKLFRDKGRGTVFYPRFSHKHLPLLHNFASIVFTFNCNVTNDGSLQSSIE